MQDVFLLSSNSNVAKTPQWSNNLYAWWRQRNINITQSGALTEAGVTANKVTPGHSQLHQAERTKLSDSFQIQSWKVPIGLEVWPASPNVKIFPNLTF